MNAERVVSKALAMGVRLTLSGEVVKLRGPAESIAAIKPELAAYKSEVVDYLRRTTDVADELQSYPVADGPFMPYMVPLSPERVAGLVADLRSTIAAVADIEGWSEKHRAYVLGLVARQPISTLTDDLAYFRSLLGDLLDLSTVERVAQSARRVPTAPSSKGEVNGD